MLIVKRIIHFSPLLAAAHQTHRLEQAKLVADGRLVHAKQRREIAYAKLLHAQRTENTRSGLVAEHFKQLSNVLQLAIFRHAVSQTINHIFVDMIHFTAQILRVHFCLLL